MSQYYAGTCAGAGFRGTAKGSELVLGPRLPSFARPVRVRDPHKQLEQGMVNNGLRGLGLRACLREQVARLVGHEKGSVICRVFL